MRKRTVKLWRLHDDGRKLFAGTIEAADPRELVFKWSAFLATAEKGVYFATYRGSFIAPEPSRERERRSCGLEDDQFYVSASIVPASAAYPSGRFSNRHRYSVGRCDGVPCHGERPSS